MKILISLFILLFITTLSFSQNNDFSGIKVMINPGHGGHDSDDRGLSNGFWESESNLTKGLWLQNLLIQSGCEVIISRELNRTEDDLPLSQIVAIANESEVDLFVAIHSNAANRKANYPMGLFNGYTATPTNPEAKVFARILWEHLVSNQATYWSSTTPHAIGDLTLNPTWKQGYGVLYPLRVTGIISEGSFHDYEAESNRLLNTEYRKQEAWNIFYAMADYFDVTISSSYGNISGIIRDSLQENKSFVHPDSPDRFGKVNNATVTLLNTNESYVTDIKETGYYYFDSIPEGDYQLVFSATNYDTDTVAISVEANQFSYHNHWLKSNLPTAIQPQEQAAYEHSITAYPNPLTGNTINIDGLQNGRHSYKLFCADGRTIQEGTIDANSPSIYLRSYIEAKGVFILSIYKQNTKYPNILIVK